MSSVGKKNKSGPGSRLRFRLDSRIYDPPFAKTRLTAQTLRSAAEISANLAAKASLSSRIRSESGCHTAGPGLLRGEWQVNPSIIYKGKQEEHSQ